MSIAESVQRPVVPIARYYGIISVLGKFLGYLAIGLKALFTIMLAYNAIVKLDVLTRANDVMTGIKAYVNEAVVPLVTLLALIFAIKILAKIFENEAKAVEEHIRERLIGELVLRGRLDLNEVKERYGFKNVSNILKLLQEGLDELGLRMTLDQTGNEVYLS
ncbi:hypothetical protein Pyrfu_1155 [Pyrolobus fumarii 1A]|uniref:Uncharacterized protein n=1 Tax=Pyrolobus fumarii (strain DSM 11204 / 1A) TaxID=694429 RepID=G0EFJ6_PYRF1|nr:hypothetical protein [Pyrolobus fumarii]AEM39020.1 hypothetical protein Pyrfu_1155 [Pyrolobus fumarii 1A]